MRVGFVPKLADSGALISGLVWQFLESAPQPFILGQISAYGMRTEKHMVYGITSEILGWVAKKPSVPPSQK
ncbi:hypothetical protein PRIPAC_87969, partial [Pristionchus pacificus]|uniref:Uncharacterized protein n=1 Tax=Pristionchus pacificus TaxID=54126 RepID=A0A2A6B8K6_PRIPA